MCSASPDTNAYQGDPDQPTPIKARAFRAPGFAHLVKGIFSCELRGQVEIKGKGPMLTGFLGQSLRSK